MPAWALGLTAVLAALGGTAGVKSIVEVFRPPPATAEQQDDLRAEIRQLRHDFDEDRKERKRERKQDEDRNRRRWDIVVGYGCRLNGTKAPEPFARNQDCDAVVWDPPPLGKKVPWTAREEWVEP